MYMSFSGRHTSHDVAGRKNTDRHFPHTTAERRGDGGQVLASTCRLTSDPSWAIPDYNLNKLPTTALGAPICLRMTLMKAVSQYFELFLMALHSVPEGEQDKEKNATENWEGVGRAGKKMNRAVAEAIRREHRCFFLSLHYFHWTSTHNIY